MVASTYIAVTLLLAAPPTASDKQIGQAIAISKSMCDSIWSFDVSIESSGPRPPSSVGGIASWLTGGALELVPYYRWSWVRENELESIEVIPVEDRLDSNGLPINREATVRDGQKEYCLRNWDWDDPQKISPLAQGSVFAEIRFQSNQYQSRDPAQLSLLFPRFELTEPRLDLEGFVSRFGTKTVASSDSKKILIELSDDSLGKYSKSESVVIELDKAHGYFMSRFVRLNGAKYGSVRPGESFQHLEYNVEEFVTLADGITLPSKVVYSVLDAAGGKPIVLAKHLLKWHSVNQPISSDRFQWMFPEHSVVRDSTQDEGSWFLWGSDNRPRLKFSNRDELIPLDPNGFKLIADQQKKQNKVGNTKRLFLVANVLFFSLFASLLVYRRWKRQVQDE